MWVFGFTCIKEFMQKNTPTHTHILNCRTQSITQVIVVFDQFKLILCGVSWHLSYSFIDKQNPFINYGIYKVAFLTTVCVESILTTFCGQRCGSVWDFISLAWGHRQSAITLDPGNGVSHSSIPSSNSSLVSSPVFSGLGARTATSRPTGLVTLRFYNHATTAALSLASSFAA